MPSDTDRPSSPDPGKRAAPRLALYLAVVAIILTITLIVMAKRGGL